MEFGFHSEVRDSPQFYSAAPAMSPLQNSVCNLLSMQFISSQEDFQGVLQSLNRGAMVSQQFSTVWSDLNRATKRYPGGYVEQFALACGSEVLNEESCLLGVATLVDVVRRLKGKCDVQALLEVSKEYELMLDEQECRDLLRLYQQKHSPLLTRRSEFS